MHCLLGTGDEAFGAVGDDKVVWVRIPATATVLKLIEAIELQLKDSRRAGPSVRAHVSDAP